MIQIAYIDFLFYFSCVVFVPVDVIKERLQVQSQLGRTNYKGSMDALGTIVRHEGIIGLYKGFNATLLSFGPFSALYFLFYEEVSCYINSFKKSNHILLNCRGKVIFPKENLILALMTI